jgi:hypothetical protein
LPVVAGAILSYILTITKWRKAMVAISEMIRNIGGVLLGELVCLTTIKFD